MGIEPTTSNSTLTYTSELILCFTICVLSATRHNIHMYSTEGLILEIAGNIHPSSFGNFWGAVVGGGGSLN